jgi:hypothetical protein
VTEYDIFVPLYYNDGTRIEAAKFQDLQARLLERFEGLTYFPQPNEGFWKFGNMIYHDEIVMNQASIGAARHHYGVRISRSGAAWAK